MIFKFCRFNFLNLSHILFILKKDDRTLITIT